MTTELHDEHVLDDIPVYVTGGCSAEEAERFDAHIQSCAPCSAALVDAQAMDESLRMAFKDVVPQPDFEDRMLAQFRLKKLRPRLHPFVRQAAIGVAATILLGGVGFFANQNIGRLERVRMASNLRQVGEAMQLSSDAERNPEAVSALAPLTRDARNAHFVFENALVAPAAPPLNIARRAGERDADEALKYSFHGIQDGKLGLKSDNTYTGATTITAGSSSLKLDGGTVSFGTPQLQQAQVSHGRGGQNVLYDDIPSPTLGPVAAFNSPVTTPPPSASDAQAQKAAEGAPAQTAPPPATPPETQQNALESRKIIRQGEMAFEVDSFDSTVMNIGKIVAEEGGFVATTDSDKLANGKVRGTVVLRVPPEHLDTLVLKLRGIGDLTSQKITAQDITKQYTDLESELRAAQAMEERLLDIIKNGKGAVKDLLEAEKQLGVWREKIEQVEGEIRYDNNLISLSTLSISLTEREIKSAAFTSIREQVTMALETDKVEEAYNAAKDAIANAKGRIVQSELKQYEAGQFGATICAQLPPDAADAVVGRLRQLEGRLANFQRQRSQSNEGGTAAPLDPTKEKREDVILNFTIFNLANIAPRRTTNLTLASNHVEEVYASILDQAAAAGARVVTSNLNRQHADQSSGSIQLHVPAEKADALLASFRGAGEIISQQTDDNPDTQNVTAAKRGIIVQIVALATVPARQSEQLQIAASDVPGAFNSILDALRAGDARIVTSQLNQQDPANISGSIIFEIARTARSPIDSTVDKAGDIVSRNIIRSQDTDNTVDSKVHVELTLQSAAQLPARETTTIGMEVADVQKSVDDLLAAATDAGGREIDKDISQDQNGKSIAHVTVEVPLAKTDSLADQVERMGHRRDKQVARNPQAPQGRLARGRLEITFADAAASLGGDETTWDAIRHGLAVSGMGLRWSVQMIVIGFCFVAPWALLIWGLWKFLRRATTPKTPGPDPAPAAQ
jgi:hypothetical protein